MANPFASPAGPPTSYRDITPSDGTLISGLQYLYITTGGDLALKGVDDAAATTPRAVAAGALIPFGAGYVMSAGTTASGIVGIG